MLSNKGEEHCSGVDVAASWWSRLLAQHSLVLDSGPAKRMFVVVCSAKFGAVALPAAGVADDLVSLQPQEDLALTEVFVENPLNFIVMEYEPVPSGEGILLHELVATKQRYDLVQHACLRRYEFCTWELRRASAFLERPPQPLGVTFKTLLHRLFKVAFPDDEVMQAHLQELYAKPAEDDDDDNFVDDPEMQALLEELAAEDFDNAKDLPQYKRDFKRKKSMI